MKYKGKSKPGVSGSWYAAQPGAPTGYGPTSGPSAPVTGWGSSHGETVLHRPPVMPGPSEIKQPAAKKRRMPVPMPPMKAGVDND